MLIAFVLLDVPLRTRRSAHFSAGRGHGCSERHRNARRVSARIHDLSDRFPFEILRSRDRISILVPGPHARRFRNRIGNVLRITLRQESAQQAAPWRVLPATTPVRSADHARGGAGSGDRG